MCIVGITVSNIILVAQDLILNCPPGFDSVGGNRTWKQLSGTTGSQLKKVVFVMVFCCSSVKEHGACFPSLHSTSLIF